MLNPGGGFGVEAAPSSSEGCQAELLPRQEFPARCQPGFLAPAVGRSACSQVQRAGQPLPRITQCQEVFCPKGLALKQPKSPTGEQGPQSRHVSVGFLWKSVSLLVHPHGTTTRASLSSGVLHLHPPSIPQNRPLLPPRDPQVPPSTLCSPLVAPFSSALAPPKVFFCFRTRVQEATRIAISSESCTGEPPQNK